MHHLHHLRCGQPRRATSRRRASAPALFLVLAACHTQRTVTPTNVPQGMASSPVQLHMGRPVAVTGMVAPPWRRAEPPRPVHEPAATRIVGRVRWSSADSLEIAPRDIYGERGWQSVEGLPPIRLAWADVARAEQKKLSPGRTAGAIVASTLFVVVAAVVVAFIIVDPYSPSS